MASLVSPHEVCLVEGERAWLAEACKSAVGSGLWAVGGTGELGEEARGCVHPSPSSSGVTVAVGEHGLCIQPDLL